MIVLFVNLSCLIGKSTALVPKNVEGRSGYPKMHHIYAEFRKAPPEKCPKILGIAHLQGGGKGVTEFVQSIKFIDSFSTTCLTYSCQDIQGKPTKERGEKGKTQAN